MFEAMEKDTVRIGTKVLCPECSGSAEAEFSAKEGKVRLNCENCKKVRERIIQYGGGAVIGESHNSDQ